MCVDHFILEAGQSKRILCSNVGGGGTIIQTVFFPMKINGSTIVEFD